MKKLVALILMLAMLATLTVSVSAEDSKPYAGVKLTYWVKLHENLDAAKVTNMDQTRWYEAVKEATGIEIEFIHPAAGQDGTEFNLLTAVPDEMPDIVEYSWTAYPGGASAAIEDEVIIDIRDLLEERAREGIEVRFLNENIANFPIPSTYYNRMRKSGIEVERFTSSRQGLLSLAACSIGGNHEKLLLDGPGAQQGLPVGEARQWPGGRQKEDIRPLHGQPFDKGAEADIIANGKCTA